MTTYLGFKALLRDPRGGRYISPLYNQIWSDPPGIAEATCQSKRLWGDDNEPVAKHTAPGTHCNCGFHAAWDLAAVLEYTLSVRMRFATGVNLPGIGAMLEPLAAQGWHLSLVVVEGGGLVERHETGWRSQFMTVKYAVADIDLVREDAYDMIRGGQGLELLVMPDHSIPWALHNPGEAILQLADNHGTIMSSRSSKSNAQEAP